MSDTKTFYCSMLVFSKDLREVVLLTKNKGPSFLLGKLCGIGGKLEKGESALHAAVREMFEETYLDIPEDKWKYVSSTESDIHRMDIFTAIADIHEAKTNFNEKIVEPVSVHKVADIIAADTLAPDTIAPDLKKFILEALNVHMESNRQVSPNC